MTRLRDLLDDLAGIIGSKPKERTDDLPLFGPPPVDTLLASDEGYSKMYPHFSPRAATSQTAYDAAKPKALSKKKRILLLLEASGGMTRSEIAWSTKFGKDTVNGRVNELCKENKAHEAGTRAGEKLVYPGGHPK